MTSNTWSTTPRRARVLAGALGAFGTLSGFAVFVLLQHEGEHLPWVFVSSLLVAAVVSCIIEMTRDLIRHGEIEPHELTPPRMIVTILTLATFELFVAAWHALPEVWKEIAHELPAAVLGPELAQSAGATGHLIALAALWVVLGVGLAVALSHLVTEDETGAPLSPGVSAFAGAGSGLLLAPTIVLAFLIVARAVGILLQMIFDHATWRGVMNSLVATGFWPLALPARIVVWLDGLTGVTILAPLVSIGIVVALAVKKRWLGVLALVFFVVPYLRDLSNLFMLLALAALVFGLPGAVLGGITPLLRRPSAIPATWSLVAFLTGTLLVALTLLGKTNAWFLVPAVVLLAAGIAFRRVPRLEEYWPLLALCIGLGLFSTTVVVQEVTFRGVFSRFHVIASLSDEPVAKPAEPEPVPATFEQEMEIFQPTLSSTGASFERELLKVRAQDATDEERIAKLDALRDEIDRRIRFDDELEKSGDGSSLIGSKLDAKGRASMRELERSELTRIKEKIARDRAATAAKIAEAKERARAAEERAREVAIEQAKWEHDRPDRTFELCVTGSLGFWITVGLLAAWAQLRHRKHDAAPPTHS